MGCPACGRGRCSGAGGAVITSDEVQLLALETELAGLRSDVAGLHAQLADKRAALEEQEERTEHWRDEAIAWEQRAEELSDACDELQATVAGMDVVAAEAREAILGPVRAAEGVIRALEAGRLGELGRELAILLGHLLRDLRAAEGFREELLDLDGVHDDYLLERDKRRALEEELQGVEADLRRAERSLQAAAGAGMDPTTHRRLSDLRRKWARLVEEMGGCTDDDCCILPPTPDQIRTHLGCRCVPRGARARSVYRAVRRLVADTDTTDDTDTSPEGTP